MLEIETPKPLLVDSTSLPSVDPRMGLVLHKLGILVKIDCALFVEIEAHSANLAV